MYINIFSEYLFSFLVRELFLFKSLLVLFKARKVPFVADYSIDTYYFVTFYPIL